MAVVVLKDLCSHIHTAVSLMLNEKTLVSNRIVHISLLGFIDSIGWSNVKNSFVIKMCI